MKSSEEHHSHSYKKRTLVVVLLSLCVTFGAGHFYMQDRFTAFVLGLLEATGFMFFFLGYAETFVVVMIFGPIIFDLIDSYVILNKEQQKTDVKTDG